MEESPVELNLEKSHLTLRDGVLVKHAAGGKIVARHVLADITKVQMIRKFETVNILISLAAFALAGVAYTSIEHSVARWGVTILLGIIALIGAAIVQQFYLELECDKETVRYPMNDPEEDAQGFFISLKKEWEATRRKPKVISEYSPPGRND